MSQCKAANTQLHYSYDMSQAHYKHYHTIALATADTTQHSASVLGTGGVGEYGRPSNLFSSDF